MNFGHITVTHLTKYIITKETINSRRCHIEIVREVLFFPGWTPEPHSFPLSASPSVPPPEHIKHTDSVTNTFLPLEGGAAFGGESDNKIP